MKFIKILFLFIITPHLLAGRDTENLNLTDEDRKLAKTYRSEEHIKRELDKLCEDEGLTDGRIGEDQNTESLCGGEKVEGLLLGAFNVNPDMMNKISDAYGKFSMMFAGNSFMSPQNQAQNPQAPNGQMAQNPNQQAPAKKDGQGFDYCAPIGGGMEMLGNLKQQLFQQHVASVPTTETSQQLQALHSIKQNYREAAKTSELKAVGWGTTGSCYGIKIASAIGTGFFSGETLKDTVKMTAASILGFFHGSLIKRNRNAAAIISRIIRKLPKAGDCNPITQRNCFCSLDENAKNVEYCQPKYVSDLMSKFSTTVPCLDKKGQPDIKCNCRRFRNCMDANFNKVITGLNVERGKTKSLRKKVAELSNGVFGQGGRLGTGTLANNAIKNIKRNLAKIDSRIPVKGLRLNSSQNERAKSLFSMGIPKRAAARFSSLKSTGQNLYSKFNPSPYQSSRRENNYNKSRFKKLSGGGGRIGRNSSSSRNSRDQYGARSPSSGSGKVEKFAEQAASRASIHQKKHVNIFKIISRRYQLTNSIPKN